MSRLCAVFGSLLTLVALPAGTAVAGSPAVPATPGLRPGLDFLDFLLLIAPAAVAGAAILWLRLRRRGEK